MTRISRRFALLLAAGIGMAAAAPAFATPDLSIVTRAGRNPFSTFSAEASAVPTTQFFGVFSPDDAAVQPGWRFWKLQFLDASTRGGLVVAQLVRKSRTSGVERVVATLRSTPSASIKVLSTPLPAGAIDFSLYGYYVRVDATLPGEAHMVMLTNK